MRSPDFVIPWAINSAEEIRLPRVFEPVDDRKEDIDFEEKSILVLLLMKFVFGVGIRDWVVGEIGS